MTLPFAELGDGVPPVGDGVPPVGLLLLQDGCGRWHPSWPAPGKAPTQELGDELPEHAPGNAPGMDCDGDPHDDWPPGLPCCIDSNSL
jgi:hypothetical protein